MVNAQLARTYQSVVIVCTRNRTGELEQCLQAIREAEDSPRVLVVDSSDPECRERNSRVVSSHGAVHLGSPIANLAYQRNLGIAASSGSDLRFFIDDDVMVDSRYFVALTDAAADANTGVGILVGIDRERQPRRSAGRLLRVGIGEVAAPGQVSRAGVPEPITRADLPLHREPSWVEGAAFAVRDEVFEQFRFNTALGNLPSGGVCYGEDVDFSLRASAYFRIDVVPAATFAHSFSDTNRRPARADQQSALRFRGTLALQRLGDVKLSRVLAVSFMQRMLLTAANFTRRR